MTDQASGTAADTQADTLMQAGVAALKSGNAADAIAAFEQAARHAPQNPTVLHNLGCALLHAKRVPEAEGVLRQSVQITNSPLTWMVLGELYEGTDRKPQAFGCYKNALKVAPNHYKALMRLGALKEAMSDKPGASDCYRRALEAQPRDARATLKYATLIFEKEPETAVRLAEEALRDVGDNLTKKAALLEHLVCRKEWWERIKRGEMPYHAKGLDELFFNYARDYAVELDAVQQTRLAADPTNPSLHFAAGLARFFLNDRHAAERLFRASPKTGNNSIFDAIRFAPSFYDELRAFTDADLTRTLPPVLEIARLVPDTKGILYLSCNFAYFRAFALPMIVSLREHSPQAALHIHIMDADETETAFAYEFMKRMAPMKFALSVERPGLTKAPSAEARSYYHAVRFIRFYEHLRHYGVPLWIMDVDAVVNRNLDDMFARLNEAEMVMRIRPGRLEPWNQFSACSVGAGTSGRALEYVRLVAAYLAYFFQRNSLRWGIDQLAMYGAYADMQDRGEAPSLSLLGEKEVDLDYSSDSFVWCSAGTNKFRHLQRVSQPDRPALTNAKDNRYVSIFEHYWKECERIAGEIPIAYA